MFRNIAPLIICLVLLLHQAPSQAQNSTDGNTTTGSDIRIDFTIVFSSFQLALETWDDENEPDTVKIEAYKRASGYLVGIPFHYEYNRDRMTINEQVDEVADNLEYKGYQRTESDYYEFNYTVTVPATVYSEARQGTSVQGHGTSDLEETVEAREEARTDALKMAVYAAIRSEYVDKNKPIPGIVDGRIMWYEVVSDSIDPESGLYVYDINAWIEFGTGQENAG